MVEKIVIVDADGTVADCTHRLHFVKTKPKNYKAFYAGIHADTPMTDIIEIVWMFSERGFPIFFCSGRPNYTREQTTTWLKNHMVPFDKIYLRDDNDRRSDPLVKSDMLDKILLEGFEPHLIFEDRASVVSMWRNRGYRCLSVSEGNF